MKVCLYSNYLNAHQIPLVKAFLNIKGVDYVFVATTPFNQKRYAMGYRDMNQEEFVVRAYESKDQDKIARQLALEGDIVMFGHSPLKSMMERLAKNKITFRVGERLFKNGTDLFHLPLNLGRAYKHKLFQCQKLPLFFLAMSAYLSYDVNCFTKYPNRVFKWGYFIGNKEIDYNLVFTKRRNRNTIKIIWIGRLLPLKHPDVVVRLAEQLKKKKYSFECYIYGEGEMQQDLISQIQQKDLVECVHLNGFISQDRVRLEMEDSDIFLFTSDYKEGWGAVLSEAMSSGCAVVASSACGAAPFLIKEGINGYMYHYGDEKELQDKVEDLINNSIRRNSFQKNAFTSMRNVWNAETAAERLLCLVDKIKHNEKIEGLYLDGPCSIAPTIINY